MIVHGEHDRENIENAAAAFGSVAHNSAFVGEKAKEIADSAQATDPESIMGLATRLQQAIGSVVLGSASPMRQSARRADDWRIIASSYLGEVMSEEDPVIDRASSLEEHTRADLAAAQQLEAMGNALHADTSRIIDTVNKLAEVATRAQAPGRMAYGIADGLRVDLTNQISPPTE